MPPPLFAIEPVAPEAEKSRINLLPCRIHHDGDVNTSDTFWNPTKAEDGLQTAYLRGRKLHGETVKLPEGYRGVVVEKTDAKPSAPTTRELGDEDVMAIDDPDDQLEVGEMKAKATFDELTIWGHESTSDSSVDPFMRGMQEWISLAEELHAIPAEPEPSIIIRDESPK